MIVNTQFKPETTIYLLKSVPIDAMKNTFWGLFKNQKEQFSFFINNFNFKKFDEYTYQRMNGTIQIEGVYDDLREYNYLIYQNRSVGNGSKWIYCFITNIGYINEDVSAVAFETDVIQTWRFEIEENMLPSYIAYEHRDRWYIDDNGKKAPCINTQPEGLEQGTDMVKSKSIKIFNTFQNSVNFFIFAFTEDLNAGGITSITCCHPDPIHYYIIPVHRNGLSKVNFMRNGTTYETINASTFLNKIRNSETLAGKCTSITMMNHLSGLTVSAKDGHVDVNASGAYTAYSYDGKWMLKVNATSPEYSPQPMTTNEFKNNEDHSTVFDLTTLLKFEESKLYTYPYSYSILTTNNGAFKLYKNELWLNMKEVQFRASGTYDSTSPIYIPIGYKRSGPLDIIPDESYRSTKYYHEDITEGLEDGSQINIPIVSDYTAMMMQSARNSMSVGVSNQVRTSEAATKVAAAQNAAASTVTASQNRLLSSTMRNNFRYQTDLNENEKNMMVLNNGSSGVGQLLSLNLGGMVGNLLQTSNNYSNADVLLNMSQTRDRANTSAQIVANNQVTAAQNRANYLATMYTNQANVQNAIDSYNAKIHDAQATADIMVSSGTQVGRCLGLGLNVPVLTIYQPTEEYIRKLTNIFHVRGYATNLIEMPNLHTRENWNYIQTQNVNIREDGIDPADMQKIRMVFDNGITLWHTLDICNYSLSNNEIRKINTINKYGSVKEQ